jgi:peptide/nickel transport system substrate-binding protein
MRRTHLLSLLMLGTGVALLVVALTAGVAAARTHEHGSSNAKRGGTLRLAQSAMSFSTLDPQLALFGWSVLSNTQLLLVNFPDKVGVAGTHLFPEAAKSFPTISKSGKVVTFHLRPGLKFDNGKPVTAASFQRAFERALSPKMYAQFGCNEGIDKMIVGGTQFANCAGKKGVRTSAHISGIRAKGLTLTFHLTRPNAAFASILAMPWFGATPPNMRYSGKPGGIRVYPSAGPYYLASNDLTRLTVLKRNPYYLQEGSWPDKRPANPDEIVIHSYPGSNGENTLLQTEKGEIDMDLTGVPASDVARVARQYGVNTGRFHVGSTGCNMWVGLNNAKAPTNVLAIRKAINYALGRKPIIQLAGPYSGTPSDQILVPGMPGYEKITVYPAYPDLAKARRVGGSAIAAHAGDQINIYYLQASPLQTNIALYEQRQLQALGFKNVQLQPADPTSYEGPLGTKSVALSANGYNLAWAGWCPDYFDPFDYFNVLFDGRTISDTGNLDFFYFNSPKFDAQMDHAASLSGAARNAAYAALDKELMTRYAPLVPLYVSNARFLTSKRVENFIYSNYYGSPDLNAMVVR